MSMTKNEFLFRLIAMIVIGAGASLLGAISSSWWAGGLFGLLFGFVFSLFDQRFLAAKVFGKVGMLGKEVITWYFVHSVLSGVGYLAMVYAFGFAFGITATAGWLFYGLATATYAVLSQRSLREFFHQLPMYWATRR